MPKDLFGEDEEFQPEGTLKLNKAYAEKYDTVKRKQELQKLTQKYGDDEDDSEEESEDDDASDITETKEDALAEVLLKLRTNDPSIKDPNRRFFTEGESGSDSEVEGETKKSKPFTLKDEYQRRIQQGEQEGDENGEELAADQPRKRKGPQDPQQKALKEAFLKSLNATEETISVVKKQGGTAREGQVDHVPKKEAVRSKMQKALLTGVDPNSKDEAFLIDFFLNDRWKDKETSDDPLHFNLEQIEAEDAEDQFFDEAEQWEQEFQQQKYRHEEGEEALRIQTFPRNEDGLLREKDDSRKEARQRKKERESAKALQATEELKRLKHLKMKEIEEQRALIQKIAGMASATKKDKPSSKGGLAISKEDLEADYDPEKFDEMMAKMFGEDYYNEEDPELEKELEMMDEGILPEGVVAGAQAHGEGEGDVVDDELGYLYPTAMIEGQAQQGEDNEFEEDVVGEEADFNEDKLPSLAAIEKDLEKKMDEYWRLHYNSIVGGVRTRFRYRQVPAETFGLSDEDVLTMDDRTLNMRTPMNCYNAYLSASDNKRDRFRSIHRSKNLRMLPAERKSRRYKTDTRALPTDIDEEEGKRIAEEAERVARKVKADVAILDVGEKLQSKKKQRKE
jgi:protein KRI1